MKNNLKKISETVAKANDLFYGKFDSIDTLVGIMDKTLRNQGLPADAVTIDCVTQDKKIVFLIHDDKPETVSIALGNKGGEIYSSSEYAVNEITEAVIVGIMEANFTSK